MDIFLLATQHAMCVSFRHTGGVHTCEANDVVDGKYMSTKGQMVSKRPDVNYQSNIDLGPCEVVLKLLYVRAIEVLREGFGGVNDV